MPLKGALIQNKASTTLKLTSPIIPLVQPDQLLTALVESVGEIRMGQHMLALGYERSSGGRSGTLSRSSGGLGHSLTVGVEHPFSSARQITSAIIRYISCHLSDGYTVALDAQQILVVSPQRSLSRGCDRFLAGKLPFQHPDFLGGADLCR
jgi:hypothetical protein